MVETKSNWDIVAKKIASTPRIHLGKYASFWMHNTPRRMLHSQSYYRFASKLIGREAVVLDVGCNDGLGTYLLGKECGKAHGVDFDKEAILSAKANFEGEGVTFSEEDFFHVSSDMLYNGITSFDVIEHIYPENAPLFIEKIACHLTREGVAVIGTPSMISQTFASEISKKGHVNIYDDARFYDELRQQFKHVFLFSANDELIHTGFHKLAHYFIAVCTGRR